MTEDSNLNKALFKYFSGIADYQDKILIREWLSFSERNKREFDLIKNQFESHKIEFDQDYVEDRFNEFKSRFTNRENIVTVERTISNQKRLIKWYYRAAASVLLFVALIFSLRYIINTSKNSATQTLESNELLYSSTKYGQKLHVNLSDGSEVWLNSGSGIYYPAHFSDSIRKVTVYGEVFFEISHDVTRPFIVISKTLQAEVLGTSFNVRAFEEESVQKISLVTGKVKVSTIPSEIGQKQNVKPVYLTPGNEVIHYERRGQVIESPFNVHQATSWKEGKLIFNEDNFHEMIIKLERWYGIEIDYRGTPPKDFIVKGEFTDENLTNVLEVLKFGRNFDYDLDKNNTLLIILN